MWQMFLLENIVHILGLLAQGNVEEIEINGRTRVEPANGTARFLTRLRSNMTEETWKQVKKVCRCLSVSL